MEILELGFKMILRSVNSSRLSIGRRVTSRESEGDMANEVEIELMEMG